MSDQEPTNEAFQHGPGDDIAGSESCPSFETLSAFADGELDPVEASIVAGHLATCSSCQLVIQDISILSRLVAAAPVPAAGRSFRLTSETPGLRVPTTPESPVPIPTPIHGRRRIISLYPFATAIAALLLIAVITGDLVSNRGGSTPLVPESTPAVLYIDGTPYTQEDDNAVHAVAIEPTSDQPTGGQAPVRRDSQEQTADSGGFWNSWRLVEIILGLTVAGLLVTMMRKRSLRKREL